MKTPTCEQLHEEDGFESVSREADDSWRHGSYITEVFKRLSDETYWMVYYRLSTDGETNELREGIAQVTQVTPKKETVITYG